MRDNPLLALPTDLTGRYRYKYSASLAFGQWRHSYEIVGARGGANLHVSGPNNYDDMDHWSAGLELHSRTPLYEDRPPTFDKCWLLNCPCWHDGTTTFARERFLPMFMEGDHRRIFRRMIDWVDEKLQGQIS
jgi:hypothetical protein